MGDQELKHEIVKLIYGTPSNELIWEYGTSKSVIEAQSKTAPVERLFNFIKQNQALREIDIRIDENDMVIKPIRDAESDYVSVVYLERRKRELEGQKAKLIKGDK